MKRNHTIKTLALTLALLLFLPLLSTVAHAAYPTITFTSIPAYGDLESGGLVYGRVSGLSNTSRYAVTAFITVNGGASFWVKPYFAWPTVPLEPDGSFVIDCDTGGIDELATELRIYIVPSSIGTDFTMEDAQVQAVAASVIERTEDGRIYVDGASFIPAPGGSFSGDSFLGGSLSFLQWLMDIFLFILALFGF